MLPIKIAGLGYYLPETVLTSAEMETAMGIPPGWIESAAGIRERRRVTHETASQMGACAGRMALAHAGLGVDDIDAIIGASAAPQQTIPCTAAFVQRELGAPDGASACFDVNATCLSFLVGMQVAAHFVSAGLYRRVLLYSSEIVGRSLNPHERESAVLMGDGAAAAVVTRAEPGEASCVWHSRMVTHSSGADVTAFVGGGTLHHPNDPATTAEMNMFHMEGPMVVLKAGRFAGPFIDDFFEQLPWKRDEIEAVVPHQASGLVLKLLTMRYGFRSEQLVTNLETRGNCVAASLPLALAEAAHAGRIRRGDRVLLIGTGAGLSIGAMMLTY
jgi:3-oxoacyl-[acyl-carrier-protein] synthase III